MRKASRIVFVSWVAVAAVGCAAVTGLDNISESDCAPNCATDGQAKQDVTAQDGSGGDTNTGPDVVNHPDGSSGGSDSSQQDTSVGDTSTQETSTEGGPKDTGADSPPDTGPDVVFSDAPFDSGCGDLNTTDNCSACGDKCAAVSSSVTSASCPGSTNGAGATCSYTCATGYLDCNGATNPPDLDGCECHVPGATQAQCCATSGGDCPTQHKNGLGQPTSLFYDCVPTGTMNSQLAQDACIAYVGAANAAQCQSYSEADASLPDSWCSGAFTGDCVCWTYSGQYVGTVFDAKAQGASPPTDCYYGPSSTTFN